MSRARKLAWLACWGLALSLAVVRPIVAEDHDHATDAAGQEEHAKHGDGLPGLNPVEGPHGGFQADLPLWTAITFLIFFLLLAKFAWGPLRDGLDAREAGIRKNISDAEAHRVKSEHLFREYEAKLAKAQEEVKSILAEARRDADTAKQDILATADKESQAMRQRAVSDIERARDQALKELFEVVSSNVMQATERVVGRSLSGADQDRLVKEALASLDLRKN